MKSKLLFFSALAFVVYLIYQQTFDNPLIMDDLSLEVFRGKSWQRIYNIMFDKFIDYGRDTTQYSFLLSWDHGIPFNRMVNLVLHGLNSLLLFMFLRKLVSENAAKFVSVFFAVNPAAIHAVCYLTQRSQLLALFFGLLMSICYLNSLTSRWFVSPLYFFCSLIFFQLAAVSKEHALTLIFVYPLLGITCRKWLRVLLYHSALVGGFLVLSIAHWDQRLVYSFSDFVTNRIVSRPTFSHYHSIIEIACPVFQDRDYLYFRSILTQCGLFFRYFASWLLPLQTSIDMRFAFVESSRDLFNLGCLGIYCLVSMCLLFIRNLRLIGAGLLLAFGLFLTEFTGIRAGEMFVMYRSYLFSLAYMIVLAGVVDKVKLKPMAIVLLMVLTLVTFHRVKQFDSNKLVWVHATELIDSDNPQISCQGGRAFSNAGVSMLQEHDFRGAISYLDKAVKVNPYWSASKSNLATAHYFSGEFATAAKLFEELAADEDPEIRRNAQEQLAKMGYYKEP